jgi:hypothetical protein
MSDGAPGPSSPADHTGTDPPGLEELDELDSPEPSRPGSGPRYPTGLPTSRSYDPPPPTVLQPRKEDWEPQSRATRRPDFAERVVRTTEASLDDEGPPPPKPPPRRSRAITWEEDKPDELGLEPLEEERLSRGQLWVLASLAVLVVVLGVAWTIKSLFGAPAAGVPAAMAAPGPASAVGSASTPLLSEEDYAEAVKVTKQFLASVSIEATMPFIRDPQRVRPLMEEFYREAPWRPMLVRKLAPREHFQTRKQMLAGMVEVDDFSRRPIAFLRTPEGIKVDWESFVGFGDIPWDRLATARPTRPVLLRVHLVQDDYYNVDFTDARTHACFRMMSHDYAHRLYGYAKRDQPVFGRLMERSHPQAFTMPTVKVRFKEGGLSSEQVEITEVVSDGWLVTDDDFLPAAAPARAPRPAAR